MKNGRRPAKTKAEPKIPQGSPFVTASDAKRVVHALQSRWLTGGPKVGEFETKFAQFVDTSFAVATSNCTAALHLGLLACGIRQGDEVIVPVFTFAATANAALFCGAKPVFVDVDDESLSIDHDRVRDAVTSKTKAIIPVHYAGQPCDMDEIVEIARKKGIKIVEDCAHSTGARYMGRMTGSIGDFGAFSFYPTKNMTTCEGGMGTTNDAEIYRKVRLLREHAMTKTALERAEAASWQYDVVDLGYNYRMNEIEATLGLTQLSRLKEMNRRRVEIARRYDSGLSGLKGVRSPVRMPNRDHVFYLYVIRVDKDEYGQSRDELYNHLRERGIECGVHFTPLHMLTFYRDKLGYRRGDFPVAEKAFEEVLTLPIYPSLSNRAVDTVIREIRTPS